MSRTLAAALGGAAGAMALVGIVIILVRYCLLHNRNISRTSETNSSDPSLQAGQNIELALGGAVPYASGSQGARGFILEELNLATKNFSSINLIGYGSFGEVYKGLLRDGMIVAIKRRLAAPSQDFVNEVSNEKLEFKHRLSIARGAAKGLAHLHSLNPPLVHMNFKTANVLVDEDFIPKVADAGIRNLLDRIGGAGPSSQMTTDNLFLDPEVKETGRFSAKSDVYSFGVFLLELVSGQEARSDQTIIEWAQNYQGSSNISTIIDFRMGSRFSSEGMREFLQLIAWCVNPSSDRRPPMNYVMLELDQIHEKEMGLTTVMGEGTTTVTLGSQLFTTSRG